MTPESTPIDWDYLAAATGGDKALEAEVLTLFLSQAAQYLEALAADPAGESWAAHAHKLKGAARGIGAKSLAESAACAETAAPAARTDHLETLKGELTRLEEDITARLSKNLP